MKLKDGLKNAAARLKFKRGKEMVNQIISITLLSISVVLLGTTFVIQSRTMSSLSNLCFDLSRRLYNLQVEVERLKKQIAVSPSEEVQEDHNQEGVNDSDTEGKI